MQEWIDRQRTRYEKYGFGLWAVVLQSTGEMIGQAGVTMQPYKESEVPEIGYPLKKRSGTGDMREKLPKPAKITFSEN